MILRQMVVDAVPPAYRDVLYAAQGPVFKTDHGVFAIRYAGMNEVRQLLQ